jgi:hypothetical protein
MLSANIDAIDRELASHRLELKTLLQGEYDKKEYQSEYDKKFRFLRFEVADRNATAKMRAYSGGLDVSSESLGGFHSNVGGSMYDVTGDVRKLWQALGGRTTQIVCTNVEDVTGGDGQYNMCNVTLQLNDCVIIIAMLEIFK